MWFAYTFLKDFSDLILKHLLSCKQKDRQNILKIIKRSYSGLIQSYVQTWLVKKWKWHNFSAVFTIFHLCKWMHRLFWEEIYPNTTVLLLFLLVLRSSLWRDQYARDTWCSGSKVQCAAFDFSALLELPLVHPTGRRKWCGLPIRAMAALLSLGSCIMLTQTNLKPKIFFRKTLLKYFHSSS